LKKLYTEILFIYVDNNNGSNVFLKEKIFPKQIYKEVFLLNNKHKFINTIQAMADLEAVLADVSYLMAMEKSKCTPAARASKKLILPDPRYLTFINKNVYYVHTVAQYT